LEEEGYGEYKKYLNKSVCIGMFMFFKKKKWI